VKTFFGVFSSPPVAGRRRRRSPSSTFNQRGGIASAVWVGDMST